MQTNAYRIRYQFNAVHNIDLTHPEKAHAHTFRIIAYIEKAGEELDTADKCERIMKEYFAVYKGFHMNEIPPFKDTVPTIENMCRVFYENLTDRLLQEGITLVKLELGDSPLASYSVGSCLMAGSAYNRMTDKQYREYSRRVLERN